MVTARKVIIVEFDWIFRHLLIVVDSPFLSEKVAQAITSKNNQLVRKVSLDSPVELCQQYEHYYYLILAWLYMV